MKKLLGILSAFMCGAVLLTGCGTNAAKQDAQSEKTEPTESTTENTKKSDTKLANETKNKIDGEIKMSNGDTIDFELYPDIAPKTVANFVKNVQEGFYSGTIFHRAIDGFVIQGGGYDESYTKKNVSETVEGEFESNGVENDLSHTRGVISMARVPSNPNSATTEFFIVQSDSTYLDGDYAAFGKVTKGMDVVDDIAKAPQMSEPPTGLQNVPQEKFVISSITLNSSDEEATEKTEETNKTTEAATEKPAAKK